ncbi:SARP family transcriptional regulator [Catellatospora methionotrophica]|uniref:SARP family transcriptional regulator n=1 Tax=Catellatospora methionotrophica TaxID=121620 RepID=A0A8J3LK48_9ACTN|nr:BTAD domain-containing putative transcriptional regulator [Catellatospora methionotrophica]GIG16671.1 SARP family transcriptional regulator [Catellatospora methionotrophica]
MRAQQAAPADTLPAEVIMSVQFELLGPLAATRDGRPVALGSTKQQLVLAALLLRPGEAVSTDELARLLWGERLPPSGTSNIRTYVRGLRQALGSGTGAQIQTVPGGYLLRLPPGSRDLDRFDAATARGRAALTCGDPATARAELATAVNLWRGAPLAGLPLPPALTGSVADLAERRLLAEEDFAAAGIALGETAAVIPRLRALLDRHPLRQRAWAHLMTNLYRAGDVAGALAAFRQARQALVEQTGMDPGPDLVRLHDDILHHRLDPGEPGARPAAPPAADPAAHPRQLPLARPGFVGRGTELAQLDAILTDPPPGPAGIAIATISGMAGVGKTTLALHWAHQAADRFPDGQLYLNLHGYDDAAALSPADALVTFLEALGVPVSRIPAGVDARAGLYRSLLAARRILIVLDNARDADQVRPLLPGAGHCSVLVTSRDQLTGLAAAEGAHPLTLDVLTATESLELLRSRLGAQRVAAELPATAEMIELTGRLPLGLSIVAARVAARPSFPLEAVAAQLRPSTARLGVLAAGDIRRVFSWSYRALTPPAAHLLRLLGLHPGPDLTGAAAAAMLGRPPAQTIPLLQELTHLHLLTEHLPDRYALHDLLRSYAAELAQSADHADERHAAAHRMYDHYLHSAHPAAMLLQPTWTPVEPVPALPGNPHVPPPDRAAAMAWFQAEHPVLLRVLRQAADTGSEQYACRLAWSLAAYLAPRGLFQDQRAAQQAALAAAERIGDLDAQALACRMLARALLRLGDQQAAEDHLQRALDLYEQLGDLDSLALSLRHYTELCTECGRLDEALKHATEALRVSRQTGSRYAQARALNTKGYLHALTADYPQAIADCGQALAQQEQMNDRVGQAATLDSLGFAYHRLGEPDRAADCYEQSVVRFGESGNRFHEALTLIHLGEAREALADLPAARQAWQRAVRIYDDLGDRPAADRVRQRLAGLPPR